MLIILGSVQVAKYVSRTRHPKLVYISANYGERKTSSKFLQTNSGLTLDKYRDKEKI